MDQPRSAQRKTAPMFTPTHLDQLAIPVKRSANLDNLPRTINDWVDQVSISSPTDLAVLFDSLGGPPQADALVRCDHPSGPAALSPQRVRALPS
jgi:hypothetical protein